MTDIQYLKGTQTEANLHKAFAGESQARNRYSYYAELAASEGLEDVAAFFTNMATNEMFHAKSWYKLIKGGVMPTVIEALEEAIAGENFEQTSMYPLFAKTAEAEGLSQIAMLFTEIGKIEAQHEQKCRDILQRLKDSSYTHELEKDMTCTLCGFDFRERDKLQECPVCGKASEYFAKIL